MLIPVAIACALFGFLWGVFTERWLTRRSYYHYKASDINGGKLDPPTPAKVEDDTYYHHKLIWGVDRRAQGPLEMRQHKKTNRVEWRYNSQTWRSDSIPPEIAFLFDQGMLS